MWLQHSEQELLPCSIARGHKQSDFIETSKEEER